MEKSQTYRSQTFLVVLILLLGLRISSYFTLFPDSVTMTQMVKVVLRCFLTGTSIILLKRLQSRHPNHEINYQNITPLLLYGAYLLLGLLSFLWTSLLKYSMLQWAMVFETFVFSWFFYQLVVFYNELSGEHGRFTKLFGRATLIICLVFILGSFLDPDTYYRETHGGEVTRLGGYIINPNELGMLAVLGAVMAYFEILNRQSQRLNFLVLFASFTVLILSQSRSSLLAFLLVTALFIFRLKNIRLISFVIVVAVLTLPVLIQMVFLKAGNMNEVLSMTGRIPFWKDLLVDGFTQAPIIGHGFMCISPNDYFDSIHGYAGKMTHNTFIQVLLNLGLVGAFICLLQMVATFAVLLKSSGTNRKWLAVFMLVPVMINSMTEFGIFGESNYGIQFYHFIFLSFIITCQPKRKKYTPFTQVEKLNPIAI